MKLLSFAAVAASLAVAAALASPAALAQAAPPRPDDIAVLDAQRYPALAGVQAFLRNGSRAAQHCATTGGLYLEADALLRSGKTEQATVEAMLGAGKGKLSSSEEKRMREIAASVTQMATGLRSMPPEHGVVAYSQICIASLRQAPGLADEKLLLAKLQAVQGCATKFPAGSLDGKECVAQTFQYNR